MRWIAGGLALWVGAVGLVLIGAGTGPFPIDVPTAPAWSVIERLTSAHVIAAEVAVLASIVAWLTRHNHPGTATLVARGPTPEVARRELAGTAAYLVLTQALGALLGRALGLGPLSYHLLGSVHGTHHHVDTRTVLAWMTFNALAYVVAPWWFLIQGRTSEQSWLRSSDRRRDALVVGAVLVLESAAQLTVFGAAYFALTPTQLTLGSVLTLVVFFVGTVLPTLIIVAVVVVPRVLVLTRSPSAAVVVGGGVYAVVHLFDGWARYDSPRLAALSVGLLVLQYFVPGMFKAWLTVRTGNAWVHAWAYHAVAPHVWADTPLIVRIVGLR